MSEWISVGVCQNINRGKPPYTFRPSQLTFSAEPLGEVGERLPLCGVHVDVLSVADVFIVDDVVVHTFGPCR